MSRRKGRKGRGGLSKPMARRLLFDTSAPLMPGPFFMEDEPCRQRIDGIAGDVELFTVPALDHVGSFARPCDRMTRRP